MRYFIALSFFLCFVSCGERYLDNQVNFDGIRFGSSLTKVDSDEFAFRVVVRDAAKSFKGAREAGRYEATKYCIEKLSSSDIDWQINPDANDLVLHNGNLELLGRCAG